MAENIPIAQLIEENIQKPIKDYLDVWLPKYVLTPSVDMEKLTTKFSNDLTSILVEKLDFGEQSQQMEELMVKHILYEGSRHTVLGAEIYEGTFHLILRSGDTGEEFSTSLQRVVQSSDWTVYHDYFSDVIDGYGDDYSMDAVMSRDMGMLSPKHERINKTYNYLLNYYAQYFNVYPDSQQEDTQTNT